eukprot:TRINITY_DN224_c0_g2_i1.p1 TRINITY_DN224_c0_g2~~TRINITY_DN224_c0_g2_i1.p1  ORF type:complete len:626 (-),score=78.98 TRINITY_DN224_c0_g2_i1:162-2039(-)
MVSVKSMAAASCYYGSFTSCAPSLTLSQCKVRSLTCPSEACQHLVASPRVHSSPLLFSPSSSYSSLSTSRDRKGLSVRSDLSEFANDANLGLISSPSSLSSSLNGINRTTSAIDVSLTAESFSVLSLETRNQGEEGDVIGLTLRQQTGALDHELDQDVADLIVQEKLEVVKEAKSAAASQKQSPLQHWLQAVQLSLGGKERGSEAPRIQSSPSGQESASPARPLEKKDQPWYHQFSLSNLFEGPMKPRQVALLSFASTMAGLNLEGPGSVLEAIGVLALIVTVHECGHFFAARLQNIHVSKFSIGFGPIITKFQGGPVEYTLRAFPLGGFVAFPDEDPESDIPKDDPDLLMNRPILDRALVISAGVIANAVFAYTVLFTQVNTVGVLQQTYLPGVAVPAVVANSVASRSGLANGDVVIAVNGMVLPAKSSSVYRLVDEIKVNVGQTVKLDVIRGATPVVVELVPGSTRDGSGQIGVQLSPNVQTTRQRAANLAEATVIASREFVFLLTTVVDGLSQIFSNFSQTASQVSGPVAIVAVGAEVARSDVSGLFQFAAIVNLNLAVVNILPIPSLDGSFLLLLLIEAVRGGRKLPKTVEQGIQSSGFLLLLGTGVVLIVRDTINLGFTN